MALISSTRFIPIDRYSSLVNPLKGVISLIRLFHKLSSLSFVSSLSGEMSDIMHTDKFKISRLVRDLKGVISDSFSFDLKSNFRSFVSFSIHDISCIWCEYKESSFRFIRFPRKIKSAFSCPNINRLSSDVRFPIGSSPSQFSPLIYNCFSFFSFPIPSKFFICLPSMDSISKFGSSVMSSKLSALCTSSSVISHVSLNQIGRSSIPVALCAAYFSESSFHFISWSFTPGITQPFTFFMTVICRIVSSSSAM